MAELLDAVRTTSNDPDLDLLLIRFHPESGARREGALGMRLRDLDYRRATVWLREKYGTEREQPVSPSLLRTLSRHATDRGAVAPDDLVLRTRRGEPISRRRYNTVFDRARPCLPWADRIPVSAHVLRHTAITAVGRLAGYPTAQAFAGHSPPTVTATYMKAPPSEVAAAVAALTGEPHPLARPRSRRPGPSWETHGLAAVRRRNGVVVTMTILRAWHRAMRNPGTTAQRDGDTRPSRLAGRRRSAIRPVRAGVDESRPPSTGP